MLIAQFTLGCLMIVATVVIHGIALDRLIYMLEHVWPLIDQKIHSLATRTNLMAMTILYAFLSHIAQIWIWALCYLTLDVLPDLESALYFSTSAFTTVGFGDVYLDKDWRLLSSFEAANGFILFGWSTAFIFEVMTRIYDQKPKENWSNNEEKKNAPRQRDIY